MANALSFGVAWLMNIFDRISKAAALIVDRILAAYVADASIGYPWIGATNFLFCSTEL